MQNSLNTISPLPPILVFSRYFLIFRFENDICAWILSLLHFKSMQLCAMILFHFEGVKL